MDRLYVIVRADLPAGLQLAQSVHAFDALEQSRPDVVCAWRGSKANLIVLHATDRAELEQTAARLARAGVAYERFFEPDIGNDLTAIAACGAAARKTLAHMPLAFAPARAA